ncbi:MAG: hypothetical protein JNJ47_02115 [Alphaproteobacteria bacterium]|nr:hypothetical protein [Alphaproteobacteria bacterium]
MRKDKINPPKKKSLDKWMKAHSSDGSYHPNDAGEMLIFSTSYFEDFLQQRPNIQPQAW